MTEWLYYLFIFICALNYLLFKVFLILWLLSKIKIDNIFCSFLKPLMLHILCPWVRKCKFPGDTQWPRAS